MGGEERRHPFDCVISDHRVTWVYRDSYMHAYICVYIKDIRGAGILQIRCLLLACNLPNDDFSKFESVLGSPIDGRYNPSSRFIFDLFSIVVVFSL